MTDVTSDGSENVATKSSDTEVASMAAVPAPRAGAGRRLAVRAFARFCALLYVYRGATAAGSVKRRLGPSMGTSATYEMVTST